MFYFAAVYYNSSNDGRGPITKQYYRKLVLDDQDDHYLYVGAM